MNFAHLKMLYLIWTLPVLLLVFIYGARKRRKILSAYADARALGRILPAGLPGRRRLRAGLVLCAMLLLAVALSGPQYGFHWQQIERRGIDIMIALDCSRSMLATDIQPTRLDRAKREIHDLLGMLQGDRVGLAAFGGTAFLQCPLTIDYHAFNLFLNVLTPDYLPVGGTDLSAAVYTSLDGFEAQSAAEKALILITDGENTGSGDPMDAARAAQQAGVKIFCIGVGSGQGVPVPDSQGGFKKDAAGQIVLSHLDEAMLTRMALSTGGAYVRSVAGDMDLDTIYSGRIRAEMQGAAIEGGRKRVWADRFQWPLALAVGLLLAVLLIPGAKGVRPVLLAIMLLLPAFPAAHAGPLHEGFKVYQQGDYEKALEHFAEAQLQDPENPEILYNIGNAHYKNNDYEAAAEHYAHALGQADPELKAKVLYNLGNSTYRQGRLKEAIQNYEAALQLSPQDNQARENLEFARKQMQEQQQQGDCRDQNDKQQQDQDKQDQDKQDQDRQDQDKQDQDKQDQDKQDRDKQDQDKQDQDTQNQEQQDQDKQDQQQNQEPAPEYGSEMKADQAAGRKQSQSQSQPVPENDDAEPGQPSSRAQMLNRLKDQPGRALMPNYQKQAVDKDW